MQVQEGSLWRDLLWTQLLVILLLLLSVSALFNFARAFAAAVLLIPLVLLVAPPAASVKLASLPVPSSSTSVPSGSTPATGGANTVSEPEILM